jgi:hypothetical protein
MGFRDYATYQAYQAQQQALRSVPPVAAAPAQPAQPQHAAAELVANAHQRNAARRGDGARSESASVVLTDKEIFDAIRERRGEPLYG